MDKRRMWYVLALLGIMILLVVLLFAQGTIHRSAGITLPDPSQPQEPGLTEPGEEQLELVEIRPDTVQRAVESMNRAQSYSMTVSVATYWSGGSGTSELTAYVRNGVTRVDTVQLDGSIRRTVTDGESTFVWYDNEELYSRYATGETTADKELRIPTYEDLVDLEADTILSAEYTKWDSYDCIYAEASGGDGYTSCYWIDVDSGLLVAAQRYYQEELIYQMTVQNLELTEPAEEIFTLPDGSNPLPPTEGTTTMSTAS